MPAEAGIHRRAGMDTGFRRYDGTFVPIGCLDHNCPCIFNEEHEGFRINYFSSFVRFVSFVVSILTHRVKPLGVLAENFSFYLFR